MPSLLLLLSPALVALAAVAAFAGPSFRPGWTRDAVPVAAMLALACAALATLIAGRAGDAVILIMLHLVAAIGVVVARYAATALDGDPRQGPFMGWLALTLAAVLLVVQASHLPVLVAAWVVKLVALRQLLLFRGERAGARRAVRKWGLAMVPAVLALIVAALLLQAAYGTTEIRAILAGARGGEGGWHAVAAAACLAVAALLASAQFPLHGWLTEVMETPTPVSALLHAGVINAGGFLLIRFADVMLLAPGLLAVLALLGGLTALLAGLTMLAQPAVKTALAWSTVAQMGFMILQCGLALFPLALLHIVAHSLYKAHAFLASGQGVADVASNRRPGPVAVPSGRAVAQAFALAIAVYGAVVAVLGLGGALAPKSPQALALGGILILGVAYLVAQGLADKAPMALTRRTLLASFAATLSYLLLQALAVAVTAGTLPPTPPADPLVWAVIVLTVASFGLVALIQALFPLWSGHPAAAGLRVHTMNGFYANALVDRWLATWQRPNGENRP